jgi:hypothetical protein
MTVLSLLALAMVTADPPAPAAGPTCSVVRALETKCGGCIQAKCCSPPVESDPNANMVLGCHIGCRKQPGLDGKTKTQAIVEQCTAVCDQTFGALPAPYAKLVTCMAKSCAGECLTK